MSKKTNKTSHVMDLLTNGASGDTDSPAAESVSNQEKKNADVQSHTVTPAKVTVVDQGSRNDRLSQEILGKLTEELEQETQQELNLQESENTKPEVQDKKEQEADTQKSPSQNADVQELQEADIQEPQEENIQMEQEEDGLNPDLSAQENTVSEPVSEELPTEPVSETSAAPQNVSSQAPPKTAAAPGKEPHPIIPESQFDSRFQDREYRFINVMEQLLMRQNLEAVLTQYEVCTCPRCMSDVCALALTGLPSKYVVTSRDSISPLISYYENKYKIPVLTELMKACNKVRQNPRHKVASS